MRSPLGEAEGYAHLDFPPKLKRIRSVILAFLTHTITANALTFRARPLKRLKANLETLGVI
jgi:hypothetical protein